MKPFLKLLLGLTITALAVIVFFKSIDFSKLPEILSRISPLTLIATALLSVVALIFRALRLKVLLTARDGQTTRSLFSIITVSYMLNNVLPFRIGEAARVFIVTKKHGHSLPVSIGSLIAERLLDTIGYAVLLIIPALIYGFYNTDLKILGLLPVSSFVLLVTAGLGLLLICVLFFALKPEKTLKIIEKLRLKLPPFAAKLTIHIETMLRDSSNWLSNPYKAVMSLVWTFASILCYTVSIYLIAVNLGAIIPFSSACFTSGVVAFGVAVPSAPGFAGTLDLAIQAGLTLFNINKDTAAATAIIYHLTGWVSVTLAGLVLWPGLNISLSDIKKGNDKGATQ
ncbi:MAG: flippase-like domain-containing protein [Fibrobacteres bacterium]|nr:flippase-like domain-containing protein [Fibrobacterota bacterium]